MIRKHILLLLLLCCNAALSSQVLSYDTKVSINGNKKTTQTVIRVQVNNKEQNNLGRVYISHAANERFLLNYAHLTGTDKKTVKKVKRKDVQSRNARSSQAFHQDRMVAEFDLFWNQYPYQIEYSYDIVTDEFINVAYWYPGLYEGVPTLSSSLTVDVADNYPIHIYQTDNLSYEEAVEGKRRILKWHSSMLTNSRTELYSSAKAKLLPNVRIVPSQFYYGVNGKADSWANFGAWFESLNAEADDLPTTEKRVIDKLVIGKEEPQDIIKTLYYYLQDNTRYINVAIDVGGLKSYPASYVCQNKYGDCKALTTYMKSMLNYLGIPSYYAIINASHSNTFFLEDFPSSQFNHVILCVPLESDTVWLENTSNIAPFNYLGTFTQGRNALLIDGQKSRLVKTPEMKLADVKNSRSFKFADTDDAGWNIVTHLKLRGREFSSMRNVLNQLDKDGQEEQIQESIGAAEYKLEDWDVVANNRDSTWLKIEASGNCKSLFEEIANLKVLYPLLLEIPDFEKPEERKFELDINLPIHQSDTSIYEFSFGEDTEIELPQSIELDTKFGKYSTSFEALDNQLVIAEQFMLYRQQQELDAYPDFYDFISSIHKYKKEAAIIIIQ